MIISIFKNQDLLQQLILILNQSNFEFVAQ